MIFVPIYLAALGLALGSFVGALVWRLHEGKDVVFDRSECEHCHHKLGVWDLIPLFSWIGLKGKCRYCHKPIGWSAPMLELAMAGLFVSSYLFWPLSFMSWQAWASFALWLVYLVGLVALVVYDLRWMTLPNVIIFPLIGVAFVESAIRYSLMPGGTIVGYGIGITLGVAVLAGLYWLLYLASKGKWVGLGDVKLGIFMGIVLGWQRSLAALFLANIIGCIIVLPGLVMGKLNRKSRVPFGPFLIAAFMVSFLFGDRIIDWYLGLIMLR